MAWNPFRVAARAIGEVLTKIGEQLTGEPRRERAYKGQHREPEPPSRKGRRQVRRMAESEQYDRSRFEGVSDSELKGLVFERALQLDLPRLDVRKLRQSVFREMTRLELELAMLMSAQEWAEMAAVNWHFWY